jgi:hypothetical protein
VAERGLSIGGRHWRPNWARKREIESVCVSECDWVGFIVEKSLGGAKEEEVLDCERKK